MFLGIDTATGRGSVALLPACGPPAVRRLEERAGHARDLLAAIEALLADSARTPADLEGIGVAIGPGSFTGVRVGMATAKGLAYALDIPLAGLSTLEALARAAAPETPAGRVELFAVILAGRGEVYAARFEVRDGAIERRSEDRAFCPVDLGPELAEGVLLVGDGAAAVRSAVTDGARHREIDAPLLAGAVASWAATVIPKGARYRPGTLAPNHIRPSDAEAARRRA